MRRRGKRHVSVLLMRRGITINGGNCVKLRQGGEELLAYKTDLTDF